MPIAKLISAMATIQPSIELADRTQRRIFVASIAFGVVAALIAALLAWLVWKANNTYQDAVKSDADARIATAESRSAQANAQAAKANEGLGKSNAEIARLTTEAEQAKADRAEANKQIAVAKADAARAKEGIANAEAVSAKASVEVAQLQAVVAKAEQRRAEAEKALAEVQERFRSRNLSQDELNILIAYLKQHPVGEVDISPVANNEESEHFARQLVSMLLMAGWKARLTSGVDPSGIHRGIRMIVRDIQHTNGVFIQKALKGLDFAIEVSHNPHLKGDKVTLSVGLRP